MAVLPFNSPISPRMLGAAQIAAMRRPCLLALQIAFFKPSWAFNVLVHGIPPGKNNTSASSAAVSSKRASA